MLQRLLFITLTLCSLTATAQWQQTGSKVRYVNGLGIPTKDTAAGVAADSSQILIRPADSSLYVKYKRTWQRVGGGGGSIAGSGTTNYIPKFTSSSAIGNSQIFDNGTNVGIGTTSPSAVLDVNGIINAGSTIRSRSNISESSGYELNAISLGYSSTNAYGWITAGAASARTTLVLNAGGGNVGIGTTSPSQKLSVAGNISTGNALIENTSTNVNFGTVTAGYLAFLAGSGAERMRVTSGGNVLIGTTTDNGTDKLQVSGNTISTRYKVNTSGQTLSINNYYNTGAGNNIWIGNGGASSTSGNDNISMGNESLLNVTSAFYNVGLGSESLRSLTTGDRNMAIGFQSMYATTSGSRNVAIGANALSNGTTGSDNVAIGSAAVAVASGSKNSGIGAFSLYDITSGSSNIGIGYDAGRRISGGTANQTSSQSIYIGEDTRSSANGNTNEMVFGHTAIGQGSNTVTLGNSSITKTFLRGNTMVNTTTDNGVDELQVNGSISGIGFKQGYVTKTGAYTATNDDYVIDCTSGTFTVTLPASSGRTGRILIIKNSGAGTITVDGNAAETIDGAATYALSVQYATVQIMSDGTNWKIIAKF